MLVSPLELDLDLLMQFHLIGKLIEILEQYHLVILDDLLLFPQLHELALVLQTRRIVDLIGQLSFVTILFIKHRLYTN